MSEHTPGPWRAKGFAVNSEADKFLHVCQMSCIRFTEADGIVHEISGETAEANARLIAAAPDLLEALQAVVRDILEYEQINNLSPNPGRKNCWDSVTCARAAIAKATKPRHD